MLSTTLMTLIWSALAAFGPLDDEAHQTTSRTIVYKTTPEAELRLFLDLPARSTSESPRPVIVFFFGGGWTNGSVGQFEDQAATLAKRGLIAARAEYRIRSKHGVGPESCVADAKSAVRWIREHAEQLGVDPDRIVAAGGSAGGHLAACTALCPTLDEPDENQAISSKPSALVLFNPVLRFVGEPRLIQRLDDDEALAEQISPTLYLSESSPPSIQFFGTDDPLVEQAREFITKAKGLGVRAELELTEGVGHAFFNRPPHKQRTLDQTIAFLESLGYINP